MARKFHHAALQVEAYYWSGSYRLRQPKSDAAGAAAAIQQPHTGTEVGQEKGGMVGSMAHLQPPNGPGTVAYS
jgi:hypothetical protein